MKTENKATSIPDEAAALYWGNVKRLPEVLKRLSMHDIRTIFSEAVIPAINKVRALDRESSRSPGCSIANLENVRDLILRDVCEAEPDDPDHEKTICISYDYLRLIVDRNLGLTSD